MPQTMRNRGTMRGQLALAMEDLQDSGNLLVEMDRALDAVVREVNHLRNRIRSSHTHVSRAHRRVELAVVPPPWGQRNDRRRHGRRESDVVQDGARRVLDALQNGGGAA